MIPGFHNQVPCEDAGELIYLLATKNLVELPDKSGLPREDPDSLKIRLNTEASPADRIPEDLFQPMMEIWKQYTNGILILRGKRWEDY